MATVGADSAYATDVVAVQQVYYHQNWGFLCKRSPFDFRESFLNEDHFYLDSWMLVMSTQLMGFSIGGIARRFLVAPPSMSMSLTFHLLCLGIQTVHCQSGLIRSYIARSSIRFTRKPMLALARTMGPPESGISCTPLLLLPFGVGTFFFYVLFPPNSSKIRFSNFV